MHLADDREAPALDALDEPELPEGLPAIELLRHHPPHEPLERAQVARHGQRGVAHVVVDVERLVVDPHGMVDPGNERELLAEALLPVHLSLEMRLDPRDVEPALRTGQRRRVVEPDRADVHVGVRVLDREEARVERGEAVVVGLHRRAGYHFERPEAGFASRGSCSRRRTMMLFACTGSWPGLGAMASVARSSSSQTIRPSRRAMVAPRQK